MNSNSITLILMIIFAVELGFFIIKFVPTWISFNDQKAWYIKNCFNKFKGMIG
jgi:hypothetical protein